MKIFASSKKRGMDKSRLVDEKVKRSLKITRLHTSVLRIRKPISMGINNLVDAISQSVGGNHKVEKVKIFVTYKKLARVLLL